MADISAELVKELRERTGAGFMDCKRALAETDGDLEKATVLLRERGVAQAAKKAGRDAREGLVGSYIHTGGRLGVLIEVNCETDFVARNERVPEARPGPRDAGRRPFARSTRRIEAIPADVLAAKRAELLADESVQKKPENIREQIVDGQLRKWYQQVVLYEQPFRDTDQTVGQLITSAIATIGENIRVRRFVRYRARGGAVTDDADDRRATRPGRRRCAIAASCSSCPARRCWAIAPYGVDPAVCAFIAHQVAVVHGRRRRGRHRRRWRQHLPRPRRRGARAWTARPATTSACWPRS